MALRILVLAAFLATLPSCISWRRVPLTGRDHVSGWADQIRAAAAEAYVYAQMSYNAYDVRNPYDLGPDFKTIAHEPNNERGFAYAIFERRENGIWKEVIIAFRGTEFLTRDDWVDGNILARQNEDGLALYDRIRESTPRSVAVTVTGHSLGGGIATYVSLHRPGVSSYVFNSSPRFRLRGTAHDNRRLSIVEYGEIVKLPRMLSREATQTYISINCRRGLNAISQHFIRPLADCLTRIAAFEPGGARASLARNGIPPPVGLPTP